MTTTTASFGVFFEDVLGYELMGEQHIVGFDNAVERARELIRESWDDAPRLHSDARLHTVVARAYVYPERDGGVIDPVWSWDAAEDELP